MQRVERENVAPDAEAQSIIEESYRAMEAALEGGGVGGGEGGSSMWEEMLGGKEWNLNVLEAGGGGGQSGGGRGGGGGDGGVIYDGVGDDGMSVT
jgi:hypothetical protein